MKEPTTMKRRSFALLAGTSIAALKFGFAKAQTAPDPSLLKTTLTPYGAERAGNAAGTIPAWTGGLTTPPAGWQVGDYRPDIYASDPVVVTIDSSNMAQYADQLPKGVMAMMTKYGFSIKVQQTRRTAAAPQWVYDNIAANIATAKLDPGGGRLGFSGAYGGIPFPIIDTSDPLVGGSQLMWNHYVRWTGSAYQYRSSAWAISGGQVAISNASDPAHFDCPYYRKDGNINTWNGETSRTFELYTAPANDVGGEIITTDFGNPLQTDNEVWELLNGQGRVRKAPEVSYDTPASTTDGLADTDEFYGFAGQEDRYDWRYVGKKEMYIPYNNNTLVGEPATAVIQAHFFDPNVVRWELHRVFVVDATLHPGKRNVLPHRVLYLDEDMMTVAAEDAYDANGTLVHAGLCYFNCRPDLPGLIMANNSVHNLQTGDWTPMSGTFDEKAHPSIVFKDAFPDSMFDPQSMAASAQY
jgi:hypothetical protein